MQRVTVLAGGYGGAKLSHGLALHAATSGEGRELSVVVNTADDLELHGLHISPDLDTLMYTLAGEANTETGWGVREETWSGSGMLERYGAETWFRLGDRDLATHLVRTAGLRAGRRLTQVTGELARALGVRARLLPMTDAPVRTHVRTDDGWLPFQEYFVRRRHADAVHELRYDGLDQASASAEVIFALQRAELIVMAPSNPFLSVAPILGVPGVREALSPGRVPIVAVSPIIGGAAVRGPADRLLESLGGEASALGVARHYAERYPGLVRTLVIDWRDVGQLDEVEALGLRVLVTDTLMDDEQDRRRLARQILEAGGRGRVRRRRGGSGRTGSETDPAGPGPGPTAGPDSDAAPAGDRTESAA
ncbi:2-phospho-L-lactate transferase [soil metagenome]